MDSSLNISSDTSDEDSYDSDSSIQEIFYKRQIPRGNLTWEVAQDYILFLPDPLTNTKLCKHQYIDLYGKYYIKEKMTLM